MIESIINHNNVVFLKLHNKKEYKFYFKNLSNIKLFKNLCQKNIKIDFLNNKLQILDVSREVIYQLNVVFYKKEMKK